jgi:tryptophan halogenase
MTELRNLNNIVVVGGGTAGWMTALYLNKTLPGSRITLVESEDIGILGAGEGTTPNFVYFTDMLDIPITRLIQEADLTIKNGIKFTNWNGDGGHYYHGFDCILDLGLSAFQNSNMLPNSSLVAAIAQSAGSPIEDVNFISDISEGLKVPFVKAPRPSDFEEEKQVNPILNFNQLSYFGVHFNAAKVAKSLRGIAEERGVIRLEGVVSSVAKNEYGDIESVTLEGGKQLPVDFLFDCTGFARMFIGKEFSSTWKSHSDKLPVKSAIPFFVDHTGTEIPPYTEAVAMDYGWLWRIPTQERFGSGYVFDSDLITEDEAKQELDTFMGYEVDSPRTLKFDAGYYTEPWVGNCIAVGLSSAFIEPLEATSLWTTATTLQNVLSNPDQMRSRDPRIVDEFNKKFRDMHEQVVDFVYFHYMSNRSDTEFWKRFSDINNAPEFVQNMLNIWEYRIPEFKDFQGKMFQFDSWVSVASGLGRLNTNLYARTFESAGLVDLTVGGLQEIKRRQREALLVCVDHKSFITELQVLS